MLVFMGGFGVWAQVWSKGLCVGKVGGHGSDSRQWLHLLKVAKTIYFHRVLAIFLFSFFNKDFKPKKYLLSIFAVKCCQNLLSNRIKNLLRAKKDRKKIGSTFGLSFLNSFQNWGMGKMRNFTGKNIKSIGNKF